MTVAALPVLAPGAAPLLMATEALPLAVGLSGTILAPISFFPGATVEGAALVGRADDAVADPLLEGVLCAAWSACCLLMWSFNLPFYGEQHKLK